MEDQHVRKRSPRHTPPMSPTDTLAAAAAAAAAAFIASPAPPAAVNASAPNCLSYEASNFSTAVAAIRAEESIERLLVIANQCRQAEGTVRTPLVLLQVLALVRQYECSSASPTAVTPSSLAEYGRGMQKHGKQSHIAVLLSEATDRVLISLLRAFFPCLM
jgi:3-oxoacyl-ACP reductase-like protein